MQNEIFAAMPCNKSILKKRKDKTPIIEDIVDIPPKKEYKYERKIVRKPVFIYKPKPKESKTKQ